jgi:hypothetical protein
MKNHATFQIVSIVFTDLQNLFMELELYENKRQVSRYNPLHRHITTNSLCYMISSFYLAFLVGFCSFSLSLYISILVSQKTINFFFILLDNHYIISGSSSSCIELAYQYFRIFFFFFTAKPEKIAHINESTISCNIL